MLWMKEKRSKQLGEKEDGLGDFTADTHRRREGALSLWQKEWREGREGVMGRKVQRKHGSGYQKDIPVPSPEKGRKRGGRGKAAFACGHGRSEARTGGGRRTSRSTTQRKIYLRPAG